MGVVIRRELHLENSELICSWPGIGSIGLVAVDALRSRLRARMFGEIEPWEFFEPTKVVAREGMLEKLVFPRSRFYHSVVEDRDLIFFVGEEQPSLGGKLYARGQQAYRMANMVVDVALANGCRRVYTSGACVSLVHHEMKPRVVAVVSSDELGAEMKKHHNVFLMSDIGEGRDEGVITGLNGLLLSVARKKGLEAACLMGEIPDWLSRTPFPYPKASKSVLEAFSSILGIEIDSSFLDSQSEEIDKVVNSIYEKFPRDVREMYDSRKSLAQPGPISREEAEWMKEHIDEFLKSLAEKQDGENDDDDRPV